ncbi:MAG TPA: type II toxin-antitoxin system death-on-curing family toxin [Terriglobia bacterium]|nr:type II toxin-antitoxin system death-on-curing family toxin [Terriglobia bacterium]
MPRRATEPRWLNRLVIDSIHHDQLKEHGGHPGVRDENGLEAALARPRNKWVYGEERDLAVLAAAYGFGLVNGHPFSDGNKRVGFLAMVTFLGINGYDFVSPDAEVVTEILSLAAGKRTEEELAEWARRRVVKRR